MELCFIYWQCLTERLPEFSILSWVLAFNCSLDSSILLFLLKGVRFVYVASKQQQKTSGNSDANRCLMVKMEGCWSIDNLCGNVNKLTELSLFWNFSESITCHIVSLEEKSVICNFTVLFDHSIFFVLEDTLKRLVCYRTYFGKQFPSGIVNKLAPSSSWLNWF